MNFRSCVIAVAAAALLWAATLPLHAQGVNSSVQGAVTDVSGAVIPGADVKLVNVRTGVVLETRSDVAGNYVFPAVAPGVYSLEVSKAGFAEFKLNQFSVVVGQRATENAGMSVASQAQTVTVQANGLANLLETQSNDLGNVIGPQSVAQLPLNGRNFLQLGLLSGATQSNQGAATSAVGQAGHSSQVLSINIAGNEPDFTMYMIDGMQAVGTRAGNASLDLSMGDIDQFEVHYGFFMPDMGPNPGIVDVVTKAGGNQIHGEAYEYVRNNEMEARDYFSTTAPGPYHQNQFGVALGGPIVKNKLFYFGNYEGYRQLSSAFVSAFTPTQAMFGGDFSAAGLPPIYDPDSYNPTTGLRTQFDYDNTPNRIPPTRISSTITGLLKYYLPGSSTTGNSNVSGNPETTLNSDQGTVRFDYDLNARNQFFGQGTWLNAPNTVPGLFPSQGTAYPLNTELVALGWTNTLSPTKVNALRLGVVRDSVYDQGQAIPGFRRRWALPAPAMRTAFPASTSRGTRASATPPGCWATWMTPTKFTKATTGCTAIT